MKKEIINSSHVSNEEITSLTHRTFNEFTINELEERLETDPFLLTGMLHSTIDDGTTNVARPCSHLICMEFIPDLIE